MTDSKIVIGKHGSNWLYALPIFGECLRFRHDQAILRNRDEREVRNSWDRFGLDFTIVSQVCEVIRKRAGWCSSLFVPEDNAGEILFPCGDFGLESIEIMRQLEQVFGIREEMLVELFQRSVNQDFGEFLRCIVEGNDQATPPKN